MVGICFSIGELEDTIWQNIRKNGIDSTIIEAVTACLKDEEREYRSCPRRVDRR